MVVGIDEALKSFGYNKDSCRTCAFYDTVCRNEEITKKIGGELKGVRGIPVSKNGCCDLYEENMDFVDPRPSWER